MKKIMITMAAFIIFLNLKGLTPQKITLDRVENFVQVYEIVLEDNSTLMVDILPNGIIKTQERAYSRSCVVSKVTSTQVTFEENGNLWVWNIEPKENFKIGEKYIVNFKDNNTISNIYDDIIVSYEKEVG